MRTYCTACGAERSILDDTPVNVAGQPSKIGGGVARVVGWLILLSGSLLGLTIGSIIQAFIPTMVIGWILGGFIGGLSLIMGLFLVLGGRMLQQSGKQTEQSAHEQAALAIAARHGGSVTPAELSRAVSITEAEADALLTAMAKRPSSRVTLEVDDDGTLRYYVDAGARRPRVRATTGARIGMAETMKSDHLAEAEMASEEEAEEKGRARR